MSFVVFLWLCSLFSLSLFPFSLVVLSVTLLVHKERERRRKPGIIPHSAPSLTLTTLLRASCLLLPKQSSF